MLDASQIFVLIEDFRPAEVSSISWDFSAHGAFVKSVPRSFVSSAMASFPFCPSCSRGRLFQDSVWCHHPRKVQTGHNPQVECADVCDIEPRSALVRPEHAMQVEAIAKQRSASHESGAAAKKLRCGDGVISYSRSML